MIIRFLNRFVIRLQKLVEVRKIVELENNHSVCRELVLVKVMADKKEKQEIIAIADIFRAKVVDVAANSLMIELTGNQNKLDAFLNLMADLRFWRWFAPELQDLDEVSAH